MSEFEGHHTWTEPQRADDDQPDHDRLQEVLDLVLYAPTGFVLQVLEDIPAMAAKGRQHLELHLRNAHVVGRFFVAKTQRDLKRQVAKGVERGTRAARRPAPPGGEEAATTEGRPAAPAPLRHATGTTDPAGSTAANAAIEDYDTLSASQVVRRLDGLGADELQAVYQHEAAYRGRQTILHRAQQLLNAGEE